MFKRKNDNNTDLLITIPEPSRPVTIPAAMANNFPRICTQSTADDCSDRAIICGCWIGGVGDSDCF